MTTTNNDSQLRTFELIDEEGYLNRHSQNRKILDAVGSDVFKGIFTKYGEFVENTTTQSLLIAPNEFQFFKEVTNEFPSESFIASPEQSELELLKEQRNALDIKIKELEGNFLKG